MAAEERQLQARNKRMTALVLWGIVALFFFAVIVKYLVLVR